MSLPNPNAFSDYLVFVDESGDHGLATVNRDFPLFALAFCVFAKADYVDEVSIHRVGDLDFGEDRCQPRGGGKAHPSAPR